MAGGLNTGRGFTTGREKVSDLGSRSSPLTIRAAFRANVWHLCCVERATVDCWIGVVTEVDRRIVRVAGRLSAAQVPELFTACAVGGPVEIDLSDLVSADVAGIEALQRVRGQGATIVGTPGYIQLKLDSAGGGPHSAPPRPGRR
jgi:hypothetical protein